MSTGTFVHGVVGVEFGTIHGNVGGTLAVRVVTYDITTNQYENSWMHLVTFDPKVFDHFRDIERLVKGSIGSLSAKPEEASE